MSRDHHSIVFDAQAIPRELIVQTRWLLWRYEPRNGKSTKVPIDAAGRRVDATDRRHWYALTDALRLVAGAGADGLGIALGDGIVGVDLDGVRDPTTGAVTSVAADIVRTLASYTEVSPSGAGLHVLVSGALPPGCRHRAALPGGGHIEVYDGGRFFTVTGWRHPEAPGTVREATDVLPDVCMRYGLLPAPGPALHAGEDGDQPADLDLLLVRRACRVDPHFEALWRGDDDTYVSASEGDLAFCIKLLDMVGGDLARADRLFRKSARMRAKWDEKHRGDGATYGGMTLERAAAFYRELLTTPTLRLTTNGGTPTGTRGGRETPSLTSLPTIGRSVGSEVSGLVEACGDTLAAAGLTAGEDDPALPSLPLLGRDGYIIAGWSHVLAGYPRTGKTELLVACALDWCRAGRQVLFFTEEPRSIWTVRLARQVRRSSAPDEETAALGRLHVVFALGTDPEVLLPRAINGVEEVVVVDTLRSLLHLRDETDNSDVARVLTPWVSALRVAEKTLIMAHHERKGGGEHGEGIAGGHALLGMFDVALELLRDPNHTGRRLLRAYARLINPPELVYERDETGEFRALGDPAAVQRAEVTARVRTALSMEWQSTSEIHEGLEEPRPSKELLRTVLLELARAGEVERDPDVSVPRVQGKLVRWRLRTGSPPTVTTSLPTDLSIVGSEVPAPPSVSTLPPPPPLLSPHDDREVFVL